MDDRDYSGINPETPDHPDTARTAEADKRLDIDRFVEGERKVPEDSDTSADEVEPEPPD